MLCVCIKWIKQGNNVWTSYRKKQVRLGFFMYWLKIIFFKVRLDIWVYITEHVTLTLVILIVAGVTSIFSADGILE